ncbi:MAG: hypothetical protein RKO25_14660, partial [Candidatus Contendobacter sp.]|nr:hypothetical protein [Candidatus Contendobacter sp.]
KKPLEPAISSMHHFESHPVGEAIDLVDPETLRFVEVGGAACRMLGYRHDEFLGLPLAARFKPMPAKRT